MKIRISKFLILLYKIILMINNEKSNININYELKSAQVENLNEFNLRSNKIRTNLLLIANEELNKFKNNCHTKINDKTLKMAEKEFTLQNNQIINLKKEFFHPLTNNGQAFFQKLTNKYFYNSPDDLTRQAKFKCEFSSTEIEKREFSCNTKVSDMDMSFSPPPQKLVFRKQSIFKKKDEYFKNTTLKIFREEDDPIEFNEIIKQKDEKNKNKNLRPRKTSLDSKEIITSTISRNEDESTDNKKRFIIHKFLINLLIGNEEILKKKKLAVTGLKYLNSLSKKIKMNYKKRAFCTSGEKEAEKEKEGINIKKATSFDEVKNKPQRQNFKSCTNIYDKQSLNTCNDKKASANNVRYQLIVSAPIDRLPINDKIPEKMRRINHNIPMAGGKNKPEKKMNSKSDGKEINNRKEKKLLSGFSKTNDKDNLNHSFNLPEKKNEEEFFIKLYKC